jgi:hypothetical protein
MISTSRLQITLLYFLFKKFNIIKKGINMKDTLKLYAVLFKDEFQSNLRMRLLLFTFYVFFHFMQVT